MKYTRTFKDKKEFEPGSLERVLEAFIYRFFRRTGTKLSRPNILPHNGISIFEYPETDWRLVPFPKQKDPLFNADNLATVNRHKFVFEEKFQKAKDSAEERWNVLGQKRDISWRLHVILWASAVAKRAAASRGEAIFIECGTGKGYMAAGICDYHDFGVSSHEFFLVDTFLPFLENGKGGGRTSPANFAYSEGDGEVRNYFGKYPKVVVVKGYIPEILSDIPKKPVAFLHLDLNDAAAEQAALEVLMPQFFEGSVIVFDDYGGPGGEAQAKVHETFAKNVGRELLILPTGQAVLIW